MNALCSIGLQDHIQDVTIVLCEACRDRDRYRFLDVGVIEQTTEECTHCSDWEGTQEILKTLIKYELKRVKPKTHEDFSKIVSKYLVLHGVVAAALEELWIESEMTK